MSPEEEGSRGGGSPPAAGAALHQPHYPSTASPPSGTEPSMRESVLTPISAADTTTYLNDSAIAKAHQQSSSANISSAAIGDVEKFDGRIVYNPDGSAYIIEGESELSDDDSLPDGCIVDGRGISIPHSLVFPQIANAYYVSRLYAHQVYQQHQLQRSPTTSSNSELPVMHSYRVISYRSSDGTGQPPPNVPAPTLRPASVPVKPILMCFICKLSFGYAKSFIAHAQGEHQLTLIDEERQILSHSTASAIIQIVGKNKLPIVSFLEPVSTSTCSPDSLDHYPLQRSNNSDDVNGQNKMNKSSKDVCIKNSISSSQALQQKLTTGTPITSSSTNQSIGNNSQHQHNQWANTQVSSSAWPKLTESSTSNFSTPSSPAALKVSQSSYTNTSQQPPNFISGTTIGVCPEHIQGRPSGIECSKCELILASSRLTAVGGSLSGIHSRNSCKTLKCPKCNWHYKYQETLEIHMKEKHPDSETSCIYCIAGQPHPRLARGETYTCGYKPYRCEVCNYSTTTKGNLSIHMQSDKHLNNMQELQSGNNVSVNNPTSSQEATITVRSPLNQQNHSPLLVTQSTNQIKPKPTFRCDACNYETNVARNLRIHMTSEKHTHHMLVLQQNIKHIQTLSALQSHHQHVQQNQNQHHQQQFEQLLQLGSLDKPQHAEAALADMAYNQAILIQMITGGQLPPHLPSDVIGGVGNVNNIINIGSDVGLSPETMEPPPEPSDPNPSNLYHCCICNNFSTDSIEGLGMHLASDRTKNRENEILTNVAGHFVCKLCSYKTNLKANFQLHCKTDKHLQRLQHVNHVKEGGTQNEWKLKYLGSPTSTAQIRCHACDYYTNSIHKLALHAASPRHEAAALLLRHLLEASTNIPSALKLYHCALCGFSTKNRLPLLQHVRSLRHIQMEQLHQLQRKTGAQTNEIFHTDIGDVFQVIPDPNETTGNKRPKSPTNLLSSSVLKSDRREDDSDGGNEIKQEIEHDQDPDHEQEHEQEIETEDIITCSLCPFQASSNEELKSHLEDTHVQKNDGVSANLKSNFNPDLLCPLCQDSFKYRHDLEKHVMQIHSVNTDGLQRLLHLVDQSHWLNINPQNFNQQISCQSSPLILSSKTQEEESIEQIIGDEEEETAKCKICQRVCRSIKELQVHYRDSHSSVIPSLAVSEKHVYKYRCGQCSLAFKTLDKLQQHAQYHAIRDATKCSICCRSFRSVQSLHRHLETAHLELQEDELSQYKQNLINSHPLLHALTEEALRQQGLLNSEQINEDESKIGDDDDSEISDLPPLRKEHQLLEEYLNSQSIAEESYNDPERKFKCHRCKVAFTRQCYLTGHNKTLSHRKGEKMPYPMEKYLDPNRPYKCDVCKESFTQKNILLVHYNSVSHLHKLKRAMQEQGNNNSLITVAPSVSPTESSESPLEPDKKPYKCNICKVSYSQGSTLDIHKRSVLHQTRANKIHDLTITGQIDLTKPLIEQPLSNPNSPPCTVENNTSMFSCSKCSALFITQEQLSNHQQIYCIFSNPLALFQQITASQKGMISPSKTPPPSVSSTGASDKNRRSPSSLSIITSQDMFYQPKHKTSQIYKHLLESFGFDLVMQFNENHQRKQRKDNVENVSAYEIPIQEQINTDYQNRIIENQLCHEKEADQYDMGDEDVIPEIKKSTCQHCNKEFSSVWVLKAHCEEVHRDLVPREFLEKYAQQFKFEYEKKSVIVTAATSSSATTGPITSKPSLLHVQDNSSSENKERDNLSEHKEINSKTPEATSTTPNTTPALSNTPVSSTGSVTPTVLSNISQNVIQHQQAHFTLAQHMSEVQAACINALAASHLQQQLHQYPSLMMSMMGLPMGINVPALAAMNLQPPLVPMMLPPQNFDGNNIVYASTPTQSDLLTKPHHTMQHTQQAVSANATASQKRARTRITDDQLKILRAHFDINNSPGEDQIIDMAAQSGLPPKVIKHWFRNTLFKERQRNKDSPYNFNNPPSTTLNIEEYEKTGEAKVSPLISSASIAIEHKSEEKNISTNQQNTEIIIHNEIKQEYCDQNINQQTIDDHHSPESSGDQNSGPQSPAIISAVSSSHQDSLTIMSTSTLTQTSTMLPPKATSQNVFTPNSQLATGTLPNASQSSASNARCTSPKASDFTFNNSNGSNSGSNSSGKRANRTRFTDYQIKVLQEFFENNAYPKDDDLEYLSKLLGLSPRVIVVWFQNARQKARKVYENQPPLEPIPSGTRDNDDGTGRFQRTPGLNYQCKKCLLVFQRYYELIRHQKTHCFKEEDAKRSAQAQAAAAQVAAVFSSEDSNSSSTTTTNTQQTNSYNSQSNSEQLNTNTHFFSQQMMQQHPLSQQCIQSEPKDENFQCDKCNLVFGRFELWREHQLVHIMNPTLFPPNYPPDSAFGILQQQALQHSNLPSDMTHSLMNVMHEKKRKFDEFEENQSVDCKSTSDHNEQPKDKRLRTTILPEQLDYLYQKYQIESNPSRKMLETIAKEVGLKKRVVQVWFQNTRARERKGQFRAHSQVINKRCPFCPALFKVKSALESHLHSKHADQIARGDVNVDNIPDEELSLESSPSNSSTPNLVSPIFPSISTEVEASIKKYYEESMKRYISEFQTHANNGKQDTNNVLFPCNSYECPLDLSKPVDLSKSVKLTINNLCGLIDDQNQIQLPRSGSECGPPTDLSEKSICDDDSFSETTEFLDEENCPISPVSNSQSTKHITNSSSIGNVTISNTGGNSGSQNSGKRYRTQMSTTQVKVMKSLFSDYKTPTMAECEMLGREIGLPKRVVQVWFQNARAKEKKARLAAGLSADGAIIHRGLTGPDECKLCSIHYSPKSPLQEHIFSRKHIESVRTAVEEGTLIPPTPGAPINRESAIASSAVNNLQGNQTQTDENMMYGSLFLHPTAMFQSQQQQQQQHTGNVTTSTTTATAGECLADLLDS